MAVPFLAPLIGKGSQVGGFEGQITTLFGRWLTSD